MGFTESLLEWSGHGVYRWDADHDRLLFATPRLLTVLGLEGSPADWKGKPFRNVLWGGDAEARHTLETTGGICEYAQRILTPAGVERWIVHDATLTRDPDSGARVVEGLVRLAMDPRRPDAAPGVRSQLYRALFQGSDIAMALTDADGVLIETNPAFQRLLGYSAAELLGRHLADITHPDDYRWERARFEKRRLSTGADRHARFEKRYVRKNGSIVWARVTAVWIPDEEHRPTFALGMVEDITAMKEAETALKATRDRLRMIADRLRVVVWSTDEQLCMTSLFGGGLASAGLDPSQWVGRRLSEIQVDGEALFPLEIHRRALAGESVSFDVVFRDRCYTGHVEPFFDNRQKVRGVLGVLLDETEKRRLETETARIEQVEALGQLAGGIAHDFNNLLTAILGNVSLARARLPADRADVAQLLGEVETAAARASDLTRQLLTFSKGGQPLKRLAQLNEIAREAAANALRGSKCNCEFRLAADVWPVEVDAAQVSQALQKMVLNADQAMPAGGTVTIRTENVVVENHACLPLKPGRYVKLSIEDEGIGIPAKNLGRLFDPYFSTKERGIGLGLTTAFSIVTKHGGHITVESEEGQGARFDVYVPAALPRAERAMEKKVAGAVRTAGRVLVMDDEKPVRDLLVRSLEDAGFTVVATTNGAEAIQVYENARMAGERFDVVVLDLTVPGGMGGREALRKLRELDPAVRAIVSSGYSTDPIMADFAAYGFVGVMAKPYRAVEMVAAVTRAARRPDSNQAS